MLSPSRAFAAALLLAALASCGQSAETPQEPPEAEASTAVEDQPFPTPTGPFVVGLRELQWTDRAREDVFTLAPDDLRRVPIRFWYPAPADTPGEPAPYIFDLAEFSGVQTLEDAATVRGHAVLDAPVAADGPFPLLLYNHGGSWPRFTGTFIGEELASHGYVVASIGHDGFNQSTQRPDGSSTRADALPFPEQAGDLRTTALESWDHLETHHFPQWIADNLFALGIIEGLASDPGSVFVGAIDLDRIGALGWSFGGATSIQLVTQDPRIKAALDMDGQLFGDAHERGSSRPYMLMKSTSLEPPPADTEEERERNRQVLDELLAMVTDREDALIAASTGEGYRLEIAGTTHGTFSDFLHLTPDGTGDIGRDRGHFVLTSLARAFFDRYLKQEAAPLLDDLSSLAEVTAETFP